MQNIGGRPTSRQRHATRPFRHAKGSMVARSDARTRKRAVCPCARWRCSGGVLDFPKTCVSDGNNAQGKIAKWIDAAGSEVESNLGLHWGDVAENNLVKVTSRFFAESCELVTSYF